MTIDAVFSIPADHPALTGHFPGNPIVPGSMILEQVLAASPAPRHRLEFAKFRRPLAPGQRVRIHYSPAPSGQGIDFQCHVDERLICVGRLALDPPP